MNGCVHSRRGFYRHPYGDVGCYHVVERCQDCGARIRVDWVPHAEVRNPDALPIDPWMGGVDPRQGALW